MLTCAGEKFGGPDTEYFHVPTDPTLESLFFLRQIYFCVSIWFATMLRVSLPAQGFSNEYDY